MLKRLFSRLGADSAPEVADSRRDRAEIERLGPEPPPPPSVNRPGVTVHPWATVAEPGALPVRPGASRVGPIGPAPLARDFSWAALVLSGERLGDVVVAADDTIGVPAGTEALLDGAERCAGDATVEVPRDALVGAGIPGVTGARALLTTPGRTVLRLGPPPGARWAIVGLRSVAVLAGRLTLVDGDESRDVSPGEAALVADPTATLYLQAGNDAAVAIGFAAPGVVIRLA